MTTDRKITRLRIILLCFLILCLTSCLEVKQSINLNKDGSGDARMEIAVQQEWASQIIPKLKSDLPKGWNLVEEKQRDGKQVVVIGRKFKDITELNDNEMRYRFSSERKGFLKRTYTFGVIQLKSSDAPFPFELSVTMPGSIEETSGNKISSDAVKWSLQGFRRGTKLSVKSSAFAVPDFPLLLQTASSLLMEEKIVFVSNRSGDKGVYMMDIDGNNIRQLSPINASSIACSPDGKKVAVVNKDGLFVVDTDGNNVRKLTDNAISPTWAPDGKKIAFVSISGDIESSFVPEGISAVNVDGGAIRKLSNGFDLSPTWSPDGKRIAFESNGISVVNADGSNIQKLTNGFDQSPTWSPDGNKIAFISNVRDSNKEGIYVMNADGSGITLMKFTDNLSGTLPPTWSPNGKYITFTSGGHSIQRLYMMNADGNDVRQVSDGYNSVPAWSPDGMKIVFVASPHLGGDVSIYSMDINGRTIRKLTGGYSAEKLSWLSIPIIRFVSPKMAKTVMLVALILSGLLLLWGLALSTRKALKVMTSKNKIISKYIFCSQCGKENSRSASFCASCGQKIEI